MQPVDSAKGDGRYARGVRSPNPVVLAGIEALLAKEPTISKSELARRLGVSRMTILYAMRSMREAVGRAASESAEVRRRLDLNHVQLVERVNVSARELREDIARLRTAGVTKHASAIFSGARALVAIERLTAELLGAVQPPTANYHVQVAALFDRSIDPTMLTEVARTALAEKESHAARR